MFIALDAIIKLGCATFPSCMWTIIAGINCVVLILLVVTIDSVTRTVSLGTTSDGLCGLKRRSRLLIEVRISRGMFCPGIVLKVLFPVLEQ